VSAVDHEDDPVSAPLDHGYERGWRRYGFDNLPFADRAIHGSTVPIGVNRIFHRGRWKAHCSFGIIPPETDEPAIGMHVHRDVPTHTDVEEWYIIIDGTGEMTFSNGDSVEVSAGDMVAVHPGTGHSFRAFGDAPVRLISITPVMYDVDSPADEYPESFAPRVEVLTVDDTMNPMTARCAACGTEWERPDDDRAANTLSVWARDHGCVAA
jgi:mannose-6-phosphate isomerase-like protein (cupin superfamily)